MNLRRFFKIGVAVTLLLAWPSVALARPAGSSTTCTAGKVVIVSSWGAAHTSYSSGATAVVKGSLLNCTTKSQTVAVTTHVTAPCTATSTKPKSYTVGAKAAAAVSWQQANLPATVGGKSCLGRWSITESVAQGTKLLATGTASFTETAVAGDTDDHINPTNTSVTASLAASTSISFSGAVDGANVTFSCMAGSLSFTTPASGLGPVNLTAPPSFSGCTNNAVSGTDTVTASGTWSLKFLDAASDEAGEKSGDGLAYTVPMKGLTITPGALPSCHITLDPSTAGALSSSYDDIGTSKLTSVSVPASSAGCSATSTFTVSATLALSPAISDLS